MVRLSEHHDVPAVPARPTAVFFKTGPFAWNGVLGFWVPLTVFCGWFISIFILMRRALVAEKHDTGERTPTPVG